MRTIEIRSGAGFEEWRAHARGLLAAGVAPGQILWRASEPTRQLSLLAALTPAAHLPDDAAPAARPFCAPRAFLEMAAIACRHRDPARFALLYRLLWRLRHENRRLILMETDEDVHTLRRLVKDVRRDAYKMKAFARFREVCDDSGQTRYVCWYEPEHYALALALPFFQARLRNLRWEILTPDGAARWDGQTLTIDDAGAPPPPVADRMEACWLTYYASTFNPSRLNMRALNSQMPKKYRRHMPEAALIERLARGETATAHRIENQPRLCKTP